MKALVEKLMSKEIGVIKTSYYLNINDTTVRISNHLPNRCNWENNENLENKLFVFINENGDLNDVKIEQHLLKEFDRHYNEFILFDTVEEAIECIQMITMHI